MCSLDEPYVLKTGGIVPKDYSSTSNQHVTSGGRTAEKARTEYYGQVDCKVLQRVIEYYRMDLDMFDYETSEFESLCVSE